LISNALWKGVRLKDLLEKAQVKTGAVYIVFGCADDYVVGIPLDRALLDGTILVYEMNGVPLPQEHGRPLRAIVPGLYGMKSVLHVKNNRLGIVKLLHLVNHIGEDRLLEAHPLHATLMYCRLFACIYESALRTIYPPFGQE
jgi:hypothetical protein